MKKISLETPIIGTFRTVDSQKKALKRLRIETVRNLLYHFPSRYSHMSEVTTIDMAEIGEMVTIYGIINNPKTGKTYTSKVPTASATLTDINNDSIKITWFNQAFIAKKLHDGQSVKLTGKITESKGNKTMVNPEFEIVADMPIDTHDSLFKNENSEEIAFGYPIYRESRGITSKWMYHTIMKILGSDFLENLEDPLPIHIRQKYNLPGLATALVWIHAPKKQSDADAAKKRFAFEEIFFIQLRNQQRRSNHRKMHAYDLEVDSLKTQSFIESFPFTPTDAQSSAIESIITDLQSDRPMTRLLEGDVGSGKTFVAAVSAHAAIQNRPKKKSGGSYDFGRMQVAYMAPTEVLATQLFENFVEYFEKTGIQIGLMTGAGCRKYPSKVPSESWTNISKNQLLKWIKNGEVPIVIGTHALIQKKVEFQDLALVIIDEQHRFGTKQRMNLTTKDHRLPHYLSMTATPIPRTLALTIYGDLDLSVVDQMPSGRKPVMTKIVPPSPESRDQVYADIRERLEEGRQAYVICPRISEPDPDKANSLQLKSVKAEAKRLQNSEFKDYRVDIMHSKMKKAEKEEVMNRFYNHEIDVLVSTSVVEVGVNVPNATSIIIEGAERFGLAQLHQLRGRVIRSNHQAYCYLFADAKTEKTMERMKAIVEAKNGFELAEIDLSMRGAGDLAGVKQWGMSDLAMEAIKNIKMVEYARTEAREIIENDETLENFPELKTIIDSDSYQIHFE
ncbi:MAG: ATP-dependent DNA helicase RecG [Candidatus Pacebacteria bacterium]|nr:ATP-dependent DNA helicase RecG [Candidatus Paceibacterota bacterium]